MKTVGGIIWKKNPGNSIYKRAITTSKQTNKKNNGVNLERICADPQHSHSIHQVVSA